MIRLLKEPLLHFLVLGAVLFGLYGLASSNKKTEERSKIIVSTAQIANLRDTFARTWMRPPTAQEFKGLIEDHIRSEVYDREARALGLDRDDIVIRRRLRQKMEFFAEDMAEAKPKDADLAAYVAAHPEQFRSEDTVTFRHVFLSATRGGALEQDAAKIRAELAGQSKNSRGDVFLLGDRFTAISKGDAVRTFGEGFSEKLFAVTPGRWEGPLPSEYGLHFVLVEERKPGTLPPLNAIRAAVEREWAHADRLAKQERFYRTLQQRYEIKIETPPGEREEREVAGEVK